ncbi:MAG: MmcQ/YjbR family DNA-binding protein [Pseudomonadota bacterium]
MTLDEYNQFCGSLPNTTHVVQWGDAHVWKIGGKVFAIAGWHEGANLAVTFKCTAIAFEMLSNEACVRPAPYLASRGMTWLQRCSNETIGDLDLKEYIRQSYSLIAGKLTKKVKLELGITF